MKTDRNISVQRLTACGIIACVYAILTIGTAAISYGPIQMRLAEGLCVLPFVAPWTMWGVAVGCLLANLFSTVSALDVAVGTAATLLAAFLTSRCRNRFLAPLPPVVCNAVSIGALLAATQSPGAFWQGFGLFAVQVGAGEFAAAYGAGSLLLAVLKRQGLDERLRSIR